MERTAHPARHAAYPCFGLEYDRTRPDCRRCGLQVLCHNVFGGMVTLDKLTFEFTPKALFARDDIAKIDGMAVNRSNVEDLYRRCYYSVYTRKWPENGSLGKNWQAVVQNAKDANVALSTFITTVIAAYKITHPDTPFYVVNLTCPSSVKKVVLYSKMLKDRYGHDGIDALGMFTETETPRIEEQMLLSETIAGKWIIGCKLSGEPNAIKSLFRHNEFKLDPHWLAVEPAYVENVLIPYTEAPDVNESAAVKSHRERALSTHSMLKQRKSLARTVFSARSQIMPLAVKSVLKSVGYLPGDFLHASGEVIDALRFWNVLGLAVQQWECLACLRGEPTQLKYGTRTLQLL